MIIISTGDTSLGLKLSLSFKVQLLLGCFFVFVFLDIVQPEPNGQRVSRPQVRKNCRRVPPPEGHGFHWGTFHPAGRQSEISDAAAHTLAVASRCLTKSNGW